MMAEFRGVVPLAVSYFYPRLEVISKGSGLGGKRWFQALLLEA
jgi:hypothetical protein